MIDETRLSPQLRLPLQAAPVYRAPGSAGAAGASGVEASDWISDLLGGIQTVGQVAGPILGALGAFGI